MISFPLAMAGSRSVRFTLKDRTLHTGIYSPLSPTAERNVSVSHAMLFNEVIQLNLNSFGSSRRSLLPKASDGLYEPFCTGLKFSSFVGSATLLVGFFEVKGILNGAMI